MKSDSSAARALPILITLLALADGILHLSLDAVLFRGNFVGRLGPPPGAPPNAPPGGFPPPPPIGLPLPLNQMFVANCVGYLVLVILFWTVARRSAVAARWVNVAFILYAILAFLAWVDFGMPNPMGLGYLSKAVEVVLLIALLAYVRVGGGERRASTLRAAA